MRSRYKKGTFIKVDFLILKAKQLFYIFPHCSVIINAAEHIDIQVENHVFSNKSEVEEMQTYCVKWHTKKKMQTGGMSG